MKSRHPPVYLFTGLLIGMVAGLLVGLVVYPVNYFDSSPNALQAEDKEDYHRLIALAFQANKDIGRARARLDIFKGAHPASTLAAQANKVLALGDDPQDAQALDQLSKSLVQQLPTAVTPTQPVQMETARETGSIETVSPPPTFDADQAVSTPTSTGSDGSLLTVTPRWVTPTPVPALNSAFIIVERSEACDPKIGSPLIQVEVVDQNEKPLPGVRITVTWRDGEDVFFTGLKPGISAGYADFEMLPETAYSLRVGVSGQLVDDLGPLNCVSEDGKPYSGGWTLRFKVP